MSVDDDIDRYLSERGLLSVIDVARRFGGTAAGLLELTRRLPGLAEEAYARLLGMGLQSVAGARQLYDLGRISSPTFGALPGRRSGALGATTFDLIVEIDQGDGGPPTYITVHVPAGQTIDEAELGFEVWEQLTQLEGAGSINLTGAEISFDPVGVYVA